MLLAATALIRLSSQLLDVSVLGALLLSVDVFALARLARLPDRQRAISACWLAVLFCFSLPIEPILQRVFGYPVAGNLGNTCLRPADAFLQHPGLRRCASDHRQYRCTGGRALLGRRTRVHHRNDLFTALHAATANTQG